VSPPRPSRRSALRTHRLWTLSTPPTTNGLSRRRKASPTPTSAGSAEPRPPGRSPFPPVTGGTAWYRGASVSSVTGMPAGRCERDNGRTTAILRSDIPGRPPAAPPGYPIAMPHTLRRDSGTMHAGLWRILQSLQSHTLRWDNGTMHVGQQPRHSAPLAPGRIP